MTVIDTTVSLGALVTEHPELARELERRGFDYCCGGQRSLADACAALGADATSVAAELAALAGAPAPAAWASLDAAGLVEHLLATHHRYLWEELPRIDALVEKIVAVHGARHPELVDIADCVRAIRADLEPHMLKEERVLFPMIRELATARASADAAPAFHCGTLRNPISVMEREHDAVGGLLARLRKLTDGYRVPDDGCATYRTCFAALEELEADTHLHVHKENNLLFPLVEQLEADGHAPRR